jgi:hypothetical protein
MSYDEQVRDAMVKGPEWDAETLTDLIPDGTLKIGGRFVRVEIASGTNYTSKTHYTPLYRIVDDSDA